MRLRFFIKESASTDFEQPALRTCLLACSFLAEKVREPFYECVTS